MNKNECSDTGVSELLPEVCINVFVLATYVRAVRTAGRVGSSLRVCTLGYQHKPGRSRHAQWRVFVRD
jgi:hypothetical protein